MPIVTAFLCSIEGDANCCVLRCLNERHFGFAMLAICLSMN